MSEFLLSLDKNHLLLVNKARVTQFVIFALSSPLASYDLYSPICWSVLSPTHGNTMGVIQHNITGVDSSMHQVITKNESFNPLIRGYQVSCS